VPIEGVPIASVNWTVAEYLPYWLSEVVCEDRRLKAYQGYEGVVRLYLIPGLGKKRLSKASAQGRARLHHSRPAGMPMLQARLRCRPAGAAVLC